MKIVQPDSRSIRIVSDSGVTFHVPYRFFWNENERPAESIVLTAGSGSARSRKNEHEVRAFFLFGEIRDRIVEDACGIAIHRTWLVKTQGAVHLSIMVELDPSLVTRLLFPGVYAADGAVTAPLSFLGEKTSYPSSVLLSLGKKGLIVFSDSARNERARSGIGVAHTEIQDEPSRLRVEMRFPGIEQPTMRIGPRPDEVQQQEEETIESPGSLERSHSLFFSFAPTDEIQIQGALAVLTRLFPRPAKVPGVRAPAPEPSVDRGELAEALRGVLATHLYQKGGVAGIREVPRSPWLSSSAGLGCALALRRLFPMDAGLLELSLRLADFSLKGQLASGYFYESYSIDAGEWDGVRGSAARTLLSTGQSSRIAELLLLLSEELENAGKPFEKYFLAGLRFAEFFLDEKGRLSMPVPLLSPVGQTQVGPHAEGLGGLELFFPMALLRQKTGRDRYKKALDGLVKRFSAMRWDAFQPPSSREGRRPDVAGAFLAAGLFARMRAMGYKPVEPPVSTAAEAAARAAESTRLFMSILVPWVRVHAGHDVADSPGCIVDSFDRQRLLFAGNEAALLFLRLAGLTKESDLRGLASSLARLCLTSSRSQRLGTAFFQHTDWDEEGKPVEGKGRRGLVDSRCLTKELLAGLAIAAEFPKI
jgi:hypothetical protein